MRRSLIAASAAFAVGGSLAVAASASATAIPTGTPTDSTNASLYGLLNQTDTGLIKAQNLIVGANALAAAVPGGTVVDSQFTSAYTSPSQLTATTVPEIGTDIAASGNANMLELATCVAIDQATTPADTTQMAVANCTAANSTEMAAAVKQFTGTTQPGVATAATSWASLSSLIAVVTTDPTDFPGGLYTVDGDVSISSTATVTAIGKPIAYSATFGVSGAAAKGFVLPAGFTLTFPADFSINAALVGDEIQSTQLASPPSDKAIGSASVTSPEIAALVPGSKGVDSTAAVYVVATQTLTQPEFEVYLGQGDYILGTLTGVTFPLTVSFGEPVVGGTPTPLPVSTVTLNFPASTSPLEAKSCTSLGTLGGTMTDGAATLAATYFGDTTDSGAQTMTATPTAVTNQCATTTKTKNTAAVSGSGLTGATPTLRVKFTSSTAFKSVTIGLPKGMTFVNSKTLAKMVSGAKIKSVAISGGKLMIKLKSSVKSETITTKKSLIKVSAALQSSIKTHKTKKLTFSLKDGSASVKASLKP